MGHNNTFLILALTTIFLVAVGGTILAYRFIGGTRYEGIIINGETEIGPTWKEFRPSNLLVVEKDDQRISLKVEPPYYAMRNPGITEPSGKVINPEIKIFATNGKEYDLAFLGATQVGNIISPNVDEYVEYGPSIRLRKGVKIERVQLRSDTPIRVSKILWNGVNEGDRK